MAEVAIHVRGVSVVLGHSYHALSNISLELGAGRIIGLLGPSGAGKTTLIRAIVGRQRLSTGSMTVLGQPAGTTVLRSQVGYMTQAPSVYSDLTVRENLTYFAAMVGVARDKEQSVIAEALHTVDLADHEHQLVGVLSGGQRQRVSLAVALLGHPRLLVLDEPTVGLDPVLRAQLWQLFRRLANAGTTLLVSSHVMDEAAHCDDLVLLRDGRVLAEGTPQELCRRTGTKTVEDSFLALVGKSA